MKDLIQAILERELLKLDKRSADSTEPISPRDVKSLDVLIRAYRSFVDPANKSPADSEQPESVPPSTESLVNDVNSDNISSRST